MYVQSDQKLKNSSSYIVVLIKWSYVWIDIVGTDSTFPAINIGYHKVAINIGYHKVEVGV